jgi:adenylate cyclase
MGAICLFVIRLASVTMALHEDIANDVQNILDTPWNLRKGKVVPSTADVALAGGAVELDAAFLYADLADSSKIAKEFDRRVAAKIMKAFLATSCRLIRSSGGVIQSFDGDRVMGVFIGGTKNSNAARCALHINYMVTQLIRPRFESRYESVRDAEFKIKHGVGVDSGTVRTVRAGARDANDLIWIGRAPNLAAKLSDLRESPYHSFITATVYNRLNEESKYSSKGDDMWERRIWGFLDENITVYRSSWRWKP